MSSADLFWKGVEAARAGRRVEAREILMQVVEMDPRNESAWVWLTTLMDGLDDRIVACENVLAINPDNEKIKKYLEMLVLQRDSSPHAEMKTADGKVVSPLQNQIQASAQPVAKASNPLSVPEQLEQEGKIEEAIDAYEELASRTKDSQLFDHIFKQITRLEALRKENIRHVSPASSILRMTFTWPLVYLSFALVQTGFNPIAHFRIYLWLALPFVMLGSFLLALAEIRMRHAIWEKLFLEDGDGSSFARGVLAVAGWVFVIVPFGLILLDSLARLQNFHIPPQPLFR